MFMPCDVPDVFEEHCLALKGLKHKFFVKLKFQLIIIQVEWFKQNFIKLVDVDAWKQF